MKVIVTLPEDDRSNAARARSKAWLRRVDWVDQSKSDGHAFVGPRAAWGETVEVPVGTWYLGYVEDRRPAGQLDGRTVTLYRVGASGVTPGEADLYEVGVVETWKLDGGGGWALKIRAQVAAHLEPDTATAPDANVRALTAEMDARSRLAPVTGAMVNLEPGTRVRHADGSEGVVMPKPQSTAPPLARQSLWTAPAVPVAFYAGLRSGNVTFVLAELLRPIGGLPPELEEVNR